MYSEEHDKLIEQLRLYIREDDATFGIYQYGGGTDECYIKANKEGLRLYALELLIAAQKAEEVFEDPKQNIIPISYLENWIDQDSQVFLQYIDPVRKRSESPFTEAKSTIKDNLTTGGCLLFLIFILLAVIVGAASIFKWIF
jgi:hypothetical protein